MPTSFRLSEKKATSAPEIIKVSDNKRARVTLRKVTSCIEVARKTGEKIPEIKAMVVLLSKLWVFVIKKAGHKARLC
jgi:hypothetical protein